MYESYWQLQAKPFENVADNRFYYPGEAYQGVLLKLRYAVEHGRGAALLAGAAGLGKTMLARALAGQLPERYRPVAHLVFPHMPPDQLLAFLADELTGQRTEGAPAVQQSVRRLEQALAEHAQADRRPVVVIDEAQLLSGAEQLETLRLLLNFEHQSQPALTLLLVGQPSLLPTLDRTPELDERLAVKCLLRRFTLEETAAYVRHRLAAADAKRPIFDRAALETIHYLAHGVPRKINRLADLALLVGYAEERSSIGADHVESVAEELITVTPE